MEHQRARLEYRELLDTVAAFRMRSSQIDRAMPRGSASTPPAPTSIAPWASTSAAARPREKPSARRAAISASRWFTETVSRTVISRKPKSSVIVESTVEIWRK